MIVSSLYLPAQYDYTATVPTRNYYAFAQAAGCYSDSLVQAASDNVFQCLVGKDTEVLQQASAKVSASGSYGSWAFVPVTDRGFVQEFPSQQLQKKKLNSLRILSGVSSFLL